jgi:hypothetical protein
MLGGPESIPERPEFPYGLSLRLDEDSLKLLNLGGLPEVGAVMTLAARVVVTAVSSNEMQGEGVKRNITLQITDMDLSGGSEKKEQAQLIYTEDN